MRSAEKLKEAPPASARTLSADKQAQAWDIPRRADRWLCVRDAGTVAVTQQAPIPPALSINPRFNSAGGRGSTLNAGAGELRTNGHKD